MNTRTLFAAIITALFAALFSQAFILATWPTGQFAITVISLAGVSWASTLSSPLALAGSGLALFVSLLAWRTSATTPRPGAGSRKLFAALIIATLALALFSARTILAEPSQQAEPEPSQQAEPGAEPSQAKAVSLAGAEPGAEARQAGAEPSQSRAEPPAFLPAPWPWPQTPLAVHLALIILGFSIVLYTGLSEYIASQFRQTKSRRPQDRRYKVTYGLGAGYYDYYFADRKTALACSETLAQAAWNHSVRTWRRRITNPAKYAPAVPLARRIRILAAYVSWRARKAVESAQVQKEIRRKHKAQGMNHIPGSAWRIVYRALGHRRAHALRTALRYIARETDRREHTHEVCKAIRDGKRRRPHAHPARFLRRAAYRALFAYRAVTRRIRKKPSITIRILGAAILAGAGAGALALAGAGAEAVSLAVSLAGAGAAPLLPPSQGIHARHLARGITIIWGSSQHTKQSSFMRLASEYIALLAEEIPAKVIYDFGSGAYTMESGQHITEPIVTIHVTPENTWRDFLEVRNRLEEVSAMYCTDNGQESYAIIEQGRPALHYVRPTDGAIRKIEQWKGIQLAEPEQAEQFVRVWPDYTVTESGAIFTFSEPVPPEEVEYFF